MKKIYLVLSAIGIFSYSHAQLSLTKAFNEPIVGNTYNKKGFDSAGVVPKATGTGLIWDFKNFTANATNEAVAYSATTAVAQSSLFAGATLVETAPNGDKIFWKSASTPTTQFEMLGIYNAALEMNFTSDPNILVIWPLNSGSSTTDVATGTISVATQTGTAASTVITEGSGTGTLVLPGNVSYSNVLQVKTSQTVYATGGTGFGVYTISINSTGYSYYHSSEKFPLWTVNYEKSVQSSIAGPTITTTAKIRVNNALSLGIKETNFDASYNLYPNPTTNYFTVNLNNANGESAQVEIYNALGQLAKREALGTDALIKSNVSISDLKPGIYVVKTTLGAKVSSRKLIIE